MPAKRKSFFNAGPRPEDEAARQRDVEALIAPRRTVPQDLPLDRIAPNPFQARTTFDGLDELAEAMRQQGFVSRLRVRPDPARPGFFQLVFGERRLRAAKLAGLDTVPCDVAEHSDDELLEIGLAENIQRRDLVPLEEARAFQSFIDGRNYSIRRLAERIGKDKSYVEDRLALLQTPPDVQDMIAQRPDALRAAREIAKLPSAAQREQLIAGVLAHELNTNDVRETVRTAATTRQKRAVSPQQDGGVSAQVRDEALAIQNIVAGWRALAAQGEEEKILVVEHANLVLKTLADFIEEL